MVKHKYLNHEYVLKIFNDDGFKDLSKLSQVRELFLDEARRLAPLNHPNIVKIFDAGTFNDNAYILLEYINATRLDELMARIRRFEVNKVFDLLEDMARAFMRQEMHGIIHSEIKPQNIFLRGNNTFCLIDYGNMNDKNIKPSTQAYYAPEYFKGQISNQSDLFSLGMVAWQCLTGEPPKGVLGWKMNIPKLEPYRVDAPKELIKIMNNLLSIETATRYKTAKELLDDIECYRYRDEEPLGTVLGSAFIAISFSDDFVSVYNIINKATKRVSFKSIRMDKLHFQDEIWKNIALEIENSDVMIADFSEMSRACGPNANVLTEAAHARAIGKNIIIITRDRPEDLPFDWRYLPIITYVNSLEGLEELSEKIYSKLRVINSSKSK